MCIFLLFSFSYLKYLVYPQNVVALIHDSTMSSALRFSLVGDSNVRRHLTQFNCRNCPQMSSAEVKICGTVEIFSETLRSIRSDSTACLISCLTNFLASTSSEGPCSAVSRIEPTLLDVRDTIYSFCQEQPERTWFIAPPMYRYWPLWYADGLSEILLKFSEAFREDTPSNLLLLPSFAHPEFESDGIHLSAYSGLQFVVSLFDTAKESFSRAKKSPAALSVSQQESIRVLEDRVCVLEKDHRRLHKSVDYKSMINAEANDFAENQRLIFPVNKYAKSMLCLSYLLPFIHLLFIIS